MSWWHWKTTIKSDHLGNFSSTKCCVISAYEYNNRYKFVGRLLVNMIRPIWCIFTKGLRPPDLSYIYNVSWEISSCVLVVLAVKFLIIINLIKIIYTDRQQGCGHWMSGTIFGQYSRLRLEHCHFEMPCQTKNIWGCSIKVRKSNLQYNSIW